MTILSIDPGMKSGAAIFDNGQCIFFKTLRGPVETIDFIRAQSPALVICEDSRLQSHVFTAPSLNAQARLKVARNIGMVDMCCYLIQAACERLQIGYLAVSPKGKGGKLDSKSLQKLTGITLSTNQHERDAIVLGWPYRNEKMVEHDRIC